MTSIWTCALHLAYGYFSKAYIDDFGAADLGLDNAYSGYSTLRSVLYTVGLDIAEQKSCPPAHVMDWLGIEVNSIDMTLKITELKLTEVCEVVKSWETRVTATKKQVQSLVGVLNFVAGVSPPTRIYSNRILNFLREMPNDTSVLVSEELRKDVGFFSELIPHYNGISVIDKSLVSVYDQLEVDACLTGCGGLCGNFYYSRPFPDFITVQNHQIAHLELLNLVVAFRLWSSNWAGRKLQVYTDNMNSCMALQTGRPGDRFMQSCLRSIFLITAAQDVEILVCHRPGVQLECADALPRAHSSSHHCKMLETSGWLNDRKMTVVPDSYFELYD